MGDEMFPNDRFSSLLPETERLHDDLHDAALKRRGFVPKTAPEFIGGATGTPPKIALHQFFPAWDVQAYVRMARLPLHVHNSKYPIYEATGELPQLSDGNFLVPKDEILQHLQTFHTDLDEWLSAAHKAESFAFRAVVNEKLHRVMTYCRWVDPVTYKEITRPQLKKLVPFPLNHLLPKKIHLDSINKLKQTGLTTKEQAYVTARDCYASLNAKLAASSGDFFFGDRVSALDAAVFGHTVDALSDPQLCKAVYQYAPLLITHAERIRDAYFGLDGDQRDGPRPRALSVEQLQASYYSQNQDNYFTQQSDASFMKKVPAALQVTFLEPYRSLNWSRRELLADVEKKKREQQQQQHATGGGEDPGTKGFDKSTRNVIIGAVAAIVLYALANLPVQLNLGDVLSEDDDEGSEYDEGDDDEFYYEEDDE